MPKIFISYRRDDSAGYAQAIYNRLAQNFSKDSVFMDVDTIEPGVDFEHVIEKALDECGVLLAVIGKQWARGEPGRTSRLDNAKDYVRLEISTALARDIRVIPVLVDGMAMPSEEVLPVSLRPIIRRHAMEISNTRFNLDVERLVTAVRRALGEVGESENTNNSIIQSDERTTGTPQPFVPLWIISTVAAVAVVSLSLAIWWTNGQAPERIDKTVAAKIITAPAKKTGGLEVKSAKEMNKENPSATLSAGLADRSFRDRLKSKGEGPEMVIIPVGLFQMGDVQGGGEQDEVPVRSVRINKSFAIGRYEVTFAEYDQFAKAANRQLPGDQGWGRGRRPAIFVSWHDAVGYAKWLSAQTGKWYRLATEAEWEYAARGGNETAYWWGKDWVKGMANCRGCGTPWDTKTAPVGSFKPNPFGLFDTLGNVWEWVEECWHRDYSGAPADGSAWTSGGDCVRHVIRGGSWVNPPRGLRASNRGRYYPDNREDFIGFRLARELD